MKKLITIKDKDSIRTQSAGGVIVNKKGQVVVVDQGGTSWSLPKGHIEKGEDSLTTAKREIYEETGLSKLRYVKSFGSYQRPALDRPGEIKTLYMFLFKTDQLELLKPIDKHNDKAMWVDKEDVANLLTHPKDKEFFLKIKDKI